MKNLILALVTLLSLNARADSWSDLKTGCIRDASSQVEAIKCLQLVQQMQFAEANQRQAHINQLEQSARRLQEAWTPRKSSQAITETVISRPVITNCYVLAGNLTCQTN